MPCSAYCVMRIVAHVRGVEQDQLRDERATRVEDSHVHGLRFCEVRQFLGCVLGEDRFHGNEGCWHRTATRPDLEEYAGRESRRVVVVPVVEASASLDTLGRRPRDDFGLKSGGD